VFQSRSGFSVRRDLLRGRRPLNGAVSIPVWVFCPSRPNKPYDAIRNKKVSIPVWVFCPSRQVEEKALAVTAGVSIPVWVFCPSRREAFVVGRE